MKNLNKDVAELLKGTQELKYLNSFESLDSLEDEMERNIWH